MRPPDAFPTSHQPRCMVCGPENPQGFGLRMEIDDAGRVHGRVTFDGRHEGGRGVVHGGAVAAVLDDMLGGVLIAIQTPAVTAHLSVDYRAPIFMDRELRAEAWCERVDGRKLHLAGRLRDGDTLLAETTALFLQVPFEGWH